MVPSLTLSNKFIYKLNMNERISLFPIYNIFFSLFPQPIRPHFLLKEEPIEQNSGKKRVEISVEEKSREKHQFSNPCMHFKER
jgi:hypothetical protein